MQMDENLFQVLIEGKLDINKVVIMYLEKLLTLKHMTARFKKFIRKSLKKYYAKKFDCKN